MRIRSSTYSFCFVQIAAGEVLLHHVLIESGHDDDDKDAAEELFEEVLTGHPVIEYEDAAVFAVADGLYDARQSLYPASVW